MTDAEMFDKVREAKAAEEEAERQAWARGLKIVMWLCIALALMMFGRCTKSDVVKVIDPSVNKTSKEISHGNNILEYVLFDGTRCFALDGYRSTSFHCLP